MKKKILILIISLALIGTVLSGCVEEKKEEEPDENQPEINAIYEAAAAYLENEDLKAVIKAPDLYVLLNNTNTSDDPFILGIRSASHYAAGHIPGSVNIGFNDVFEEDNLAKLPIDKQIVVVCYTGHTASQITALLNVAGYDAIALAHGICSWTNNTEVNDGKCYDPSTFCLNLTYETGEGATFTKLYDQPTALAETVVEAASSYLPGADTPVIKVAALNELLNNTNTSDDPFILGIRTASHYAAGHIPGSVNIGFNDVFEEDNLAKLPIDKQIVVVCYTGHTASQITALLNVAGYDAIALMNGICSWNNNTDMTGDKCYDPVTSVNEGYPMVTGAEPGSWT